MVGGWHALGGGRRGPEKVSCEDENDQSLMNLRRQARAREKRRAFVAAQCPLDPSCAGKSSINVVDDASSFTKTSRAYSTEHEHAGEESAVFWRTKSEPGHTSTGPTRAPAEDRGVDKRFRMMRAITLTPDDSLLEWMLQTEAEAATGCAGCVAGCDASESLWSPLGLKSF